MPKSRRDARRRLLDILESIARIRDYIVRINRDTFVEGGMTFDAVAMNIVVIGESVVHLPSELRSSEPETPWQAIVASRNLVAHGYPELDPEVTWTIATTQLEPLELAVSRMIQRLDSSPGNEDVPDVE